MPFTRFAVAFGCVLLLSFVDLGEGAPPTDNAVIAYCYQPTNGRGRHQIFFINSDGTGNRRAIDADVGLNHHSWSPDGASLAAVGYLAESDGPLPNAEGDTWSIYTFLADGTNLSRLTTRQGVWDSDPAWSPDGARISFTRIYPDLEYREELWLMNADGTNQHWIGICGSGAQWSADGTRLVFSAQREGNLDLYTCSPDGAQERQLTHTPAQEASPSWSPDGEWIAFARSSDGGYANWEIFLRNLATGEERQLTANQAYDGAPRWSPDGTLLAFGSDMSGDQHWEIYTIRPDGSDLFRVTRSARGITAINPAWRP